MLEQCVLTDLLNDGELEQHIQKAKSVYNLSRQTLVKTITRSFGKKVTISRENSGTHLVVKFDLSYSDRNIERLAQTHGLDLLSSKYSYIDGTVNAGEFLWSYINLPMAELEGKVQAFASALSENFAQ